MRMKNKQTSKLFAGFKCLLFAVSTLVLLVIVFAPAGVNAQNKKVKKAQTHKDTTTDDKVYDVCEQMPTYEGGDAALLKYLRENLKLPEEDNERGIQGRMVVGFVVEKDGTLTNVKVLRAVDISASERSARVAKTRIVA